LEREIGNKSLPLERSDRRLVRSPALSDEQLLAIAENPAWNVVMNRDFVAHADSTITHGGQGSY